MQRLQSVRPTHNSPPWSSDEPNRFRIDWSCQNQDVFDLEMQRIFGRGWLYVGHDSESAEPGDYRTTVLAGQPISLSRTRRR